MIKDILLFTIIFILLNELPFIVIVMIRYLAFTQLYIHGYTDSYKSDFIIRTQNNSIFLDTSKEF